MTRRAADSDIASYFDARVDCCAHKEAGKRARPGRATTMLQHSLPARVSGRSILELGCGEGDLLRHLVSAGATSGTGIDLAPARIAEAKRRAQADGLGGKITFSAGNAAATAYERHDVVVLDKVICCYADWRGLLDATLPAAGKVYALTTPRTDGVWRSLMTVGIAMENLTHAIRRRGFRAYVHDAGAIDDRISSAGFRLVERGNALGWMLAIYERAGENEQRRQTAGD